MGHLVYILAPGETSAEYIEISEKVDFSTLKLMTLSPLLS
jgi:hypothetical protein